MFAAVHVARCLPAREQSIRLCVLLRVEEHSAE